MVSEKNIKFEFIILIQSGVAIFFISTVLHNIYPKGMSSGNLSKSFFAFLY